MKQTDSVYILHMQHPKFLVLDVMYQNRLSHARTCQQKLYYKVRNPHGTSLFSPSLLINQRPRCKQRGIKLAALQSSGVFDPRGSRQMSASSHLARCSRE